MYFESMLTVCILLSVHRYTPKISFFLVGKKKNDIITLFRRNLESLRQINDPQGGQTVPFVMYVCMNSGTIYIYSRPLFGLVESKVLLRTGRNSSPSKICPHLFFTIQFRYWALHPHPYSVCRAVTILVAHAGT